MHVCPMVTGIVPHVGGPISLGCPTVMIGFMPAARVSDMCVCVGPPDAIVLGSMTVMIGGMPAARLGDLTTHGGSIVLGCPTVMIGDAGSGAAGGGGGAPAGGGGGGGGGGGSGAGGDGSGDMCTEEGGDGPAENAQSAAMCEAADEGVATVEQCPLAHHGSDS